LQILKGDTGEKGVTLIEVAVVMAIVAIIGLFMAPAIGGWLDNFRIRQAAREMSSDLQFAKMKAISTGFRCTVVFNANGYVVFPDYDNDMVLNNVNIGDIDGDGDQENETTDILKSALLGRNISFDTTQGGGDGIDFPTVPASGLPTVAFNRTGLPIEQSGGQSGPVTADRSIYLQNTKNNKHLRVTVSPSGRIAINEY
jgi:prepilin-type N-terminal cleavage/methylation domain-containing protein